MYSFAGFVKENLFCLSYILNSRLQHYYVHLHGIQNINLKIVIPSCPTEVQRPMV